MKKIILTFTIILFVKIIEAQIFSDACSDALIYLDGMPDCINDDQYVPVFEDNFNDTVLDLDKWVPVVGVPRDFKFKQQKAWHLAENLVVSNGTLKITAKKLIEPITREWSSDGITYEAQFDYTTGELWSKDRFFYGKYEIRCRIPEGKGFFPAFWMYGHRENEIDVFDNLQGTEKYECGPGYDYDRVLNSNGDYDPEGCRWNTYFFEDMSEWHTYTCIYEFDRIIWVMDNRILRVLPRFNDGSGIISCGDNIEPGIYYEEVSFPRQSMQIIMNLAIRSGDEAPNNNTVFPNQYEIDYIRYYQKDFQESCKSCIDHILYHDIDNFPDNTKTMSYIQTGNNTTIKTGDIVNFQSPSIILKPGFKVENGGVFKATNVECSQKTNIEILSNNVYDNYLINKNEEPIYSIDAFGVSSFVFNIKGLSNGFNYQTGGTPTSNRLISINTSGLSPGLYYAYLQLQNCMDAEIISYRIWVTDGGSQKSIELNDSSLVSNICIDETKESDIDNLGEFIQKKCSISPNPVKDYLYINSFPQNEEFKYILYNLFGETIDESSFRINKKLDCSYLKPGIYFIRIFSTGYSETLKFIKL